MSQLSQIISMRYIVGYLGERGQCNWWPTSFFESSSRQFMEPAFPKTKELARYHGVLEAARRLHDEHLNVGSYHLFRLPEELEQDLHMLVQHGDAAVFPQNEIRSRDAALASLKVLGDATVESGTGPKVIGKVSDIHSTESIKAIAANYFLAFSQDVRVYPYLWH